MNYELSLVLFTSLTQLAVGLSCFAACYGVAAGQNPDAAGQKAWEQKAWLLVCVAAAAGLLSSFFHLGQPLRAFEALRQAGSAWLSREAVIFGIFTALALATFISKAPKALAVLTACVGVIGIIIQGFTYASVSMPAIANGVPFALFAATALLAGAACAGLTINDSKYTPAFGAGAGLFAAIMLLAPCIWSQGGAIMRASAAAWTESGLYWSSVVLVLAALVLSRKKTMLPAVCLLALAGVLAGRMIFFGGTIHMATNIGGMY